MATLACLGSCWTSFGWTFFWKRSDAQVCRRPWIRMGGRPAFFKRGARLLWRRLEGLIGVPASEVKSKPDRRRVAPVSELEKDRSFC